MSPTGLPRLGECRDCHEPIRFVRMTDTGRNVPVQPMPVDDGNVAATLRGGALVGFVISRDRRPGPHHPMRFAAHHATCTARATTRRPAAPPADAPLF